MTKIEFGEVHSTTKMLNLVKDCVLSDWHTCGKKVKDLEQKFASTLRYEEAVMVNSGTSADIAACAYLYELGATPGDEVIVPALCFIAVANAIRAAGFTPVFVDIKKETLNIDETKIEEKITPKTRAIIGVNTMGKPCKMDKIRQICDKYNLTYISDQCEYHGGRYKGKMGWEYADLCTYSCYTAHLTYAVEGGFVGCSSDKAPILRSIRSHGREDGSLFFKHDRFGLNLKPNDVLACIGLASIDDFWSIYYKRKNNWYYITQNLKELRKYLWFSEEDDGDDNCPHGISFTVKSPEYFNILIKHLNSNNIHHKRNFGCIPTQHKAFEYLGYKLGDFPESEYVGNYGVHIGCHQYLEREHLNIIVNCLKSFYLEIERTNA